MINPTLAGTDDGNSVIAGLSIGTPDGRAREFALSSAHAGGRRNTSLVTYRSSGDLLIIDQFRSVGDEERALRLARELSDRLRCTVLIGGLAPDGVERYHAAGDDRRAIRMAVGKMAGLTGHLGEFVATVHLSEAQVNLAEHLGNGRKHFDVVLDLVVPAHLRQDILPAGYYAPGDDPDMLRRALQELPEMIGEFEKPKYFNYDADICAHGNSGLKGCTRCLDACPTTAITSAGDKIEVDPYLCQGGGSCATACPTGAITYAYPAVSDLLDAVRHVLARYHEAGGKQACLLFHDGEAGRETLVRIASKLPEHVIPLQIEEVGAVGMDAWLATLAYGASHVMLLAPPGVAPSVVGTVMAQLEYAAAILEGMGYPRERVQLIMAEDGGVVLNAIEALTRQPKAQPAGFAGVDEKRTTIRLAVDHLYGQAPVPNAIHALPAGAPFGQIEVDRDGCTLCMACVSVCPSSALADSGDTPQLLFNEWNCVQCGLCETACPEHVITRVPRFVYDTELRRSTRTLNEEEPLCCIVCGKPFATQSMLKKVREKLKGHWMFQKPELVRGMQMCGDCRVKDMLMRERGLTDVYKKR